MDFGIWKATTNSEGGSVFLLRKQAGGSLARGGRARVERGENCLAARAPPEGSQIKLCCSPRPDLAVQGCCRRKITASCGKNCLTGGETVKYF